MRSILHWAIRYLTRHYEALDAIENAPGERELSKAIRVRPEVSRIRG